MYGNARGFDVSSDTRMLNLNVEKSCWRGVLVMLAEVVVENVDMAGCVGRVRVRRGW